MRSEISLAVVDGSPLVGASMVTSIVPGYAASPIVEVPKSE
jgi:hypothetical protein